MKNIFLKLDKIENEHKDYFNKKDSYKLKHYIIQKPSHIPNYLYTDLDEKALKNYPLPKEIENKLRNSFRIRSNYN